MLLLGLNADEISASAAAGAIQNQPVYVFKYTK